MTKHQNIPGAGRNITTIPINLNPRDDPNRDRPARAPYDVELQWFIDSKDGDFSRLDAWCHAHPSQHERTMVSSPELIIPYTETSRSGLNGGSITQLQNTQDRDTLGFDTDRAKTVGEAIESRNNTAPQGSSYQ